eukprot:CAMPEP_0115545532 /NCGR_PEP_ID=MMETSP0271-20121206/92655_1 /TAXON_ID=71861 /ORGANISM="Scrippsiella trochoidea, Strain CCMP3099" /LENGTH=438 /DNA_ID=CAMNT_0002978887 /DNA_START=24 /DNA_END=1340 /DNA_ORIENTATION=+
MAAHPDGMKTGRQPAGSALTAQVSATSLALAIAVGVSTQSVLCAGSVLTAFLLTAAMLNSMTQPPTKRAPPPAMGGPGGAQHTAYEDPVRWSILPISAAATSSIGDGGGGGGSGGSQDGAGQVLRTNQPQPVEVEQENCIIKALALHRPTHLPQAEAEAQYPYAWHLAGRRRIWEIRVQMRFKVLPKGPLFFGIECPWVDSPSSYVGAMIRKAISKAVGDDFYASWGDNPEGLAQGQEAEPTTFVMPLWAMDQFHVADLGQEPSLTGSLDDVGIRRTDGAAAYARAVNAMLKELSTDKVYTVAFWGPSRFVDVINWQFSGLIPGFQCDFGKLMGDPPLYTVMYELQKAESGSGGSPSCNDGRHVPSRKRYFFNVALWTALRPPPAETLRKLGVKEELKAAPRSVGSSRSSPELMVAKAWRKVIDTTLDLFACCSAREA